MDKAHDLAFEYESKYGCCTQCVLAAIQDVFGIGSDDVFRAGHALAGGSALTGDGTCGALVGGILALSYMYGRGRENFAQKIRKPYIMAKELHDKFVEEYGSCICRDVQKKIFGRSFNLWNPDEFREFEKMGGRRDKCPEVAGKVARWVAGMIQE